MCSAFWVVHVNYSSYSLLISFLLLSSLRVGLVLSVGFAAASCVLSSSCSPLSHTLQFHTVYTPMTTISSCFQRFSATWPRDLINRAVRTRRGRVSNFVRGKVFDLFHCFAAGTPTFLTRYPAAGGLHAVVRRVEDHEFPAWWTGLEMWVCCVVR